VKRNPTLPTSITSDTIRSSKIKNLEDWGKRCRYPEEIGKIKNIHEYNWRKFWDWTGIKDKKLWDFIQLSMVPMILFIGNWILQESTKRREIEVAEDKARQEALVKYTEGISDLIQKGLLNSKSDRDPNFLIAKAKTTLALISLNSQRQKILIKTVKIYTRYCKINVHKDTIKYMRFTKNNKKIKKRQ
jgi:hypothetical protein